jgi:hypothetical protein
MRTSGKNPYYICITRLKVLLQFHHSLKEHHKISNIPKFRCEML